MKVMVVEDDAALREIYGIRIAAEGYDVVSAGDGEEALAVAVREKPDLVLSDVMMPKISGFDMLDILRNTPETADIRVIMMTALSSEDQRERGESLGCNRYLVKSQIGIEDMVNAIHEVLGDKNDQTASETAQAGQTNPAEQTAPAQAPSTPAPSAPAEATIATPEQAAPATPVETTPVEPTEATAVAPEQATPATPAEPTAPAQPESTPAVAPVQAQ